MVSSGGGRGEALGGRRRNGRERSLHGEHRKRSQQPANSKDTSNNMNTSNNRNASNSVEAGNCRFFLDLATCQHHQERQQQQECQKQQYSTVCTHAKTGTKHHQG